MNLSRCVLLLACLFGITFLIAGCDKKSAEPAAKSMLQGHNYHNDHQLKTVDKPSSTDGYGSEIDRLEQGGVAYAADRSYDVGGGGAGGAAFRLTPGQSPAKPALPRKMIFNADVQIVITDKDLEAAHVQLKEMLKSHDALVTQEDVSGTTGTQRTGRWTIRVPAERFDAFLDALRGIGTIDRQVKKSSDVTEEFYDLEGRIKQKTTELADLTKILNEAAEIQKKEPKAKMEDYLAVRKTWEEVKANVERMQGRLKMLANLTDLTTVTLSIQERKNYVPETTTFSGEIGQTWGDSLDTLKRFGQGLVLFGVGLTPWLPVLALIVVPIVFLIRRAIKSSRSVPVAVAAEK